MKLIISLVGVLLMAIVVSSEEGIWVPWNGDKYGIPANAVIGGDNGDAPFYVIRAVHENHGTIVGKYDPTETHCYIPWDGKSLQKKEFEVLTYHYFIWTSMEDPRELINGGNAQFICRVSYAGRRIPGKFHRNRCYFPHAGEEHSVTSNFQVLKNARRHTRK